MQEKENKRWTIKQKKYLLDNYRKKTLKEIAVDLNKTESAVYNKAQTLGIVKKRRWTEKEDFYLEDNLGKIEIKYIAKQLFRSVSAVLSRMTYLSLKLGDDDLTLKKLAKSVGMSEFLVYTAIKEGKLKTLGRKVGKGKEYIFDIFDFRDFVLEYHEYKQLKCVDCQALCIGDIYCSEHLPVELKKAVKKVQTQVINIQEKDSVWKIGDAFRSIRLAQGGNQEQISLNMGRSKLWYGYIERGTKDNLTLQDLGKIASELGVKISIEIKPATLDKKH